MANKAILHQHRGHERCHSLYMLCSTTLSLIIQALVSKALSVLLQVR